MSVQVQHRRGAASSLATFTPAQGEIVVDTTHNQLVVGDGATAGGFSAGIARRTAVNDAPYACSGNDRIVAYTSLTAARTLMLPAAASFPGGALLTIVDESGVCSANKPILVAAAGTDAVNGTPSGVYALEIGFGSVTLESNGSNGWAIVAQTQSLAPSAHGAQLVLQWIESLVVCAGATTNIAVGQTCVIRAVALRVVTAVTGCASITVNDSQNGNGHWASGVGVSAGSSTSGQATPGPYYNGSTTLALAAVGGSASFTGGTVRVSILAEIVTPPTS